MGLSLIDRLLLFEGAQQGVTYSSAIQAEYVRVAMLAGQPRAQAEAPFADAVGYITADPDNNQIVPNIFNAGTNDATRGASASVATDDPAIISEGLSFDGVDDFVRVASIPSISDAFTLIFCGIVETGAIRFLISAASESMEIQASSNGTVRFIPTTKVFLDTNNIVSNNTNRIIIASYSVSNARARLSSNGTFRPTVNNGTNPLGQGLAAAPNLTIGARYDGSFGFNSNFFLAALIPSEVDEVFHTYMHTALQNLGILP